MFTFTGTLFLAIEVGGESCGKEEWSMLMMREFKRTLLCLLALVFILVGCTGSGDVREDDRGGDKKKSPYPEWFLNPPTAEGRVYASGTAQKDNRQLALDTATARARNEMGRYFQTRVATMIKDFLEEAGSGSDRQMTEFSQMVSKQLTDQVLVGSKVKHVHVDESTNPHTYYVLVELNLKDMEGVMTEVMESHRQGYNSFDVERDLEELIDEIKGTDTKDMAILHEDAEKAKKKEEKRVNKKEPTDKDDSKGDEVEVKQGREPDWVKRFPSDSEYYIGIGNGKSLQQSQDAAINMLVSQIRVAVKSEINDFMREANGITEEEVTQSIKLTVKESIEDLEYMDAYYSPDKGYWAYYRLNIAEYKRRQQEKMEAAKRNALDMLTKADNESDPGLALKYALLGYFHIGKYVTKALKVEYKGREVILVNELTQRIQKTLNGFQIVNNNGQIELEKISPKSQEAVFNITINGRPLKNFPIAFRPNEGALDVSESSTTDSAGNVTCIINKTESNEEVQSFIVEPDIRTFMEENFDDDDNARLYFARLVALGLPSKEILVQVAAPVFGFELELLNDLAYDSSFEPKFRALSSGFKNLFERRSGAEFTEGRSKYKMEMVIEGTVSQSEASGNYFTRMTVMISIIDTTNGQEIYSEVTPEIKGGSINEIKSVQAAINKYNKSYNERFVTKILDFIQQN